ncbi:MAG: sulfotransferase [Pseudomonadota bacterium]
MAETHYTPVVILGAARSGTNMLRDMLTRLPGFATWDCDEINPIWRHGNLDWPNDEIPPGRATPKVSAYIRRAFDRIWRASGKPEFVVEKTCANTLRVPFVDAVLPDARYLVLVRDGVDVVPSAMKRWRGDLEFPGMPYLLAKAKYAPISDLPRYALTSLKGRLGLMRGRERLSTWGPRFSGIGDLTGAPLEELCARQWAASVDAADLALAEIPPDRQFHLRYEDLTQAPADWLGKILTFLGADATAPQIADAAGIVQGGSVGKGRGRADIDLTGVLPLMQPTLARHGYGG